MRHGEALSPPRLRLHREWREEFCAALERAGMNDVKVTRMGCTVQHKQGPVVIVYPEGVWYAGVGVGDVTEIVAVHLGAGRPVERLVLQRMDEGEETS